MKQFPRLSNDDSEHRHLVLSLVWRYGFHARRVAECALKDARDRIFPSPAEAIRCYNNHWDAYQEARERDKVRVDT